MNTLFIDIVERYLALICFPLMNAVTIEKLFWHGIMFLTFVLFIVDIKHKRCVICIIFDTVIIAVVIASVVILYVVN